MLGLCVEKAFDWLCSLLSVWNNAVLQLAFITGRTLNGLWALRKVWIACASFFVMDIVENFVVSKIFGKFIHEKIKHKDGWKRSKEKEETKQFTHSRGPTYNQSRVGPIIKGSFQDCIVSYWWWLQGQLKAWCMTNSNKAPCQSLRLKFEYIIYPGILLYIITYIC